MARLLAEVFNDQSVSRRSALAGVSLDDSIRLVHTIDCLSLLELKQEWA